MATPQLVERRPDTVPVLSTSMADQLRPFLPRRYRVAPQWTLLYSLDQHGTSLATLYRRVGTNKGPCLLAIKDANDQVFGAFLNEALKPNPSYYGTGECFLWTQNKATSQCRVFPWTGRNEYMILAETDFIAVGGGDGKFGLWINSDLERGHSEGCPTFNNEPLSCSTEFSCIQLEVWGFRI
ncbi:TLD-domain-containing protein [Dichotomocladium elegans]|nr:TLD-domain-containing protein [Dichotomocladium elegans]